MKNAGSLKAWVALAVSLLVLALATEWQPFTAKAQEPKRIQYRIVEVLHDTPTMQATLNEFGSAGWDLVAVSAGDLTTPRMIFKK
jgi:hypothetical protein